MNELEFTKYLAEEAGKIMKNYFNSHLNVKKKTGLEIVTQADLAVDSRIKQLIRESEFKRYPY